MQTAVHEIVNRKVEEHMSYFQDKLLKMVESEKELIQFEVLYSMLVEPREDIRKVIKEERRKAWREALERSGWDEESAIEMFDELYP